ncbi:MAG: LysE family transporter [Peptostreptococcaceae bacterium]|nr:LysE family transporter [Peptostreptococcaceae bacterium]
MLAIFLQSLIIGYSGAIMPGPMFTYTVDKSIRYGIKPGILVSLGHVFLELILVILIFAGVGKYLATDSAGVIIGLIGGAYPRLPWIQYAERCLSKQNIP